MKRERQSFKENFPYGFPYEPYDIQKQFIENAHNLYNKGGFGIFESPTGTGKTLSVLCSALTWLEEKQKNVLTSRIEKNTNTEKISTTNAPKWIFEKHKLNNSKKVDDFITLRNDIWEDRKNRAEQLRNLLGLSIPDPIQLKHTRKKIQIGLTDSDTESYNGVKHQQSMNSPIKHIQILISSRTHSQLAQYIKEINKTRFSNNFQVISLGSRQHLCVNMNAKKVSIHAQYLNDQCRKLVDDKKCEYKKNSSLSADLALSEPTSIEDLVKISSDTKIQSCPYYGAREAAAEADVILLPYNCLLDPVTMESLNIQIEGNIIIFDEAHNIINAINSANSTSITEIQALQCSKDIDRFLSEYGSRLSSLNVYYLNQINSFCDTLARNLKGINQNKAYAISTFLVEWGLENFKLDSLELWLASSGFAQKIRGFSGKFTEPNRVDRKEISHNSIFIFHRLLISLLKSDIDDRIILYGDDSNTKVPRVELICLSAESRFKNIVQNAHAVMLLGGTMEPKREFDPLISSLPFDNIVNYTSPHIINKDQILALAISRGPSNNLLDFRFETRSSEATLKELAIVLFKCCRVIPGGCVVFLTSFSYLDCIRNYFEHNKEGSIIFKQICSCKKVFYENKTSSNETETSDLENKNEVFEEYSKYIKNSITSKNGALLFCVMNARLSEGINFTDNLARGVFIVGLPFPSEDLKLTEKMSYYDRKFQRESSTTSLYGRELKEIFCLKAVNQSLGRAIRHIKDYAAIFLLDHRFKSKKICLQLPSWIQSNLITEDDLFECENFFRLTEPNPDLSIMSLESADITKRIKKFFNSFN